MLAQNFKSADDLQISEAQKDALMKTLVLLETGRMVHAPRDLVEGPEGTRRPKFSGLFSMRSWGSDEDSPECGTIACIGGTAELIAGSRLFGHRHGDLPRNLYELFYPNDVHWDELYDITPDQAATALRSYLTTGNARWDLALAVSSNHRE